MSLRDKLGGNAAIALLGLGVSFQSMRSRKIQITSAKNLARICELAGEVDPDELWGLMVGTWLIHEGGSFYSFPWFEENNKQLFSLWANGERVRNGDAKPKATKRNRTEGKGSECNINEPNRTELDATGKAIGNALSDEQAAKEAIHRRMYGIPDGIQSRMLQPKVMAPFTQDDDDQPF